MDDRHSISNKLPPPAGWGFLMLSFPTTENHVHTSTSSLVVESPTHLLTAPPPPRTLEGPMLTPSLTITVTRNALTLSVDSSSPPLPSALPPPPPPTPVQQSSSLSRGAAGGIAVLAILALLVLASGLVWWYKRRRAKALEEDPEDALFAACEHPRSSTLRLSTVGSMKGGSRFGATFRAHRSPYLPYAARPPKASPNRIAAAAPSRICDDSFTPASTKLAHEQ